MFNTTGFPHDNCNGPNFDKTNMGIVEGPVVQNLQYCFFQQAVKIANPLYPKHYSFLFCSKKCEELLECISSQKFSGKNTSLSN